jgi:hypothetical protein
MTCFDYDDLEERITQLGFNKDTPVFKSIAKLAAVLDQDELSDTEREIVLTLFSSKGLEQVNNLPKEVLSKTKWIPFDYGNVKIGDFVRVRFDAYDSDTGVKHNNRLGILVSMAAWRCKVQYIGIPGAELMPHPMEKLESLQKV